MDARLDPVRSHLRITEFAGRVFLVGGCVRDHLLGLPDSPDIDLVLEGDAGALAESLFRAGLCEGAPVVYARYGTAMARINGLTVEIVGARAESYASDSRKPDTRPASLLDDARRRDFTINALMQNLETGEIVDLLGQGLSDLELRQLRTPLGPDRTFADDPLRMLRAVRFRHRFGLSYAPGLEEAIAASAPRAAILSAERIRDELTKMVALPSGPEALEDLRRLGLLKVFAPELDAMKGVEQGGYHHLDVWDHSLLVMRMAGAGDLTLSLAALLHDVGKPPTRLVQPNGAIRFFGHESLGAEMALALLQRLRFGAKESEQVALLVKNHMRLGALAGDASKAALRRLVRDLKGHVWQLCDLVLADTQALRPGLDVMDVAAIRRRLEAVAEEDAAIVLESPLTGFEIQNLLGLPPGPQIGMIKSALQEAVIEGELEAGDKEGALVLAQSALRSMGGESASR